MSSSIALFIAEYSPPKPAPVMNRSIVNVVQSQLNAVNAVAIKYTLFYYQQLLWKSENGQ
jgi:hypothetical protein